MKEHTKANVNKNYLALDHFFLIDYLSLYLSYKITVYFIDLLYVLYEIDFVLCH
jgi:hypothetical protein